jgi:hypothetical protein
MSDRKRKIISVTTNILIRNFKPYRVMKEKEGKKIPTRAVEVSMLISSIGIWCEVKKRYLIYKNKRMVCV